MPADTLVLLSQRIEPHFLKLARKHGERKGGYSAYIDLSKTNENLPARLYCGGIHNGIHKLQFIDVAHLGLSQSREIALKVFGDLRHVKIFRLDWCLDIWGISVQDFALYCRFARVHKCSVERSDSGISFYLRRSKDRVLVAYDKVDQLRSKRHPLATFYSSGDRLTRVELQLRGRGLPYRRLADIEKYADLDLLSGISFWRLGRKKENLKPVEALAAEGLLHKIDEFGLQMTSKMYPSATWASLQEKFLIPAVDANFPDLERLMKKSIQDWLKDRVRFPRPRKRSSE